MPSKHYTKSFYERLRDGATRSAEVVVPLVLEFLPINSVVDVGCGDGSWLATFQKLGMADILGMDGDYVERDLLQIPPELFCSMDLTKPFHLDRSFDLAVSLEVAEHLPAECASSFVKSLTRLAPLVLFSAAIPHQGGDNHINEQWPDLWARLFRECGYLPVDFIRKRVWQNDSVDFWYAQNSLLFAEESLIASNPFLTAEFERTNPNQICLVHPQQYLYLQNQYRDALARAQNPPPPSGVRAASRLLLVCLRNAFRKRIQSILGREERP
jgi:SAM-dependent methyltransferase